jgi:hypothetical protein
LTAEERETTVILYDPKLQFEKSKKNPHLRIPLVASNVGTQIAQLLRRPVTERQNFRTLTIDIRPCQQQPDFFNCGTFTIYNIFALAHNLSPENIRYNFDAITPIKMRENFGEMLKRLGEPNPPSRVEMFPIQNLEMNERHRMSTAGGGNVLPDYLPLDMKRTFITLCECDMNQHYDVTIPCGDCERQFHQFCYMIKADGSSRGLSKISVKRGFRCYQCRRPGDYSFYGSKEPLPVKDDKKINNFVKKIPKIGSHILSNFLGDVVSYSILNAELPTTVAQYDKLMEVMATYDVNCVGLRDPSSLYDAYINYLTDKIKQTYQGSEQGLEISDMSSAQHVRLCMMLICHAEDIHLEGLYKPEEPTFQTESENELEKELIEFRKNWLVELKPEKFTVTDGF